MIFLRNDIPVKVVSTDDRPIESFYVKFSKGKNGYLIVLTSVSIAV